MKWFWIRNYRLSDEIDLKNPPTHKYCSSHIVPEPIRDRVYENLVLRGVEALLVEPMTRTYFDMGGAKMIDQHIHQMDLDGLDLNFPSSHVSSILHQIKNTTPRKEIGVPYFKHHFWFQRCLCLLPDQNQAILAHLEQVLPECLAIESAENALYNDRLVGKHPHILAESRPVKIKPEEA